MLLAILLILLVIALVGGLGYNHGAYRDPGLRIVGVIILVILVLFLAGAFGNINAHS